MRLEFQLQAFLCHPHLFQPRQCQIAVVLGAISAYHAGSSVSVQHAEDTFGGAAFCVFSYVFLVAGMFAELGAAALLGLHCYLCVKGVTTFEWLGQKYANQVILKRLQRERGDDPSLMVPRPNSKRRPLNLPVGASDTSTLPAGSTDKDTEPMTPRPKRTKRHIFVSWCLPCITTGEAMPGKEGLDSASQLDTPREGTEAAEGTDTAEDRSTTGSPKVHTSGMNVALVEADDSRADVDATAAAPPVVAASSDVSITIGASQKEAAGAAADTN